MEEKVIEHAKLLIKMIGDSEVIIESLKTQYNLSDKEARALFKSLKEASE